VFLLLTAVINARLAASPRAAGAGPRRGLLGSSRPAAAD